MHNNLTIAIVDPFSSPHFLGETMQRRSVRSLAVYVNPGAARLGANMYTPACFDVVFNASGWQQSDLCASLSALGTDLLLYGNEFAVPKADLLAQAVAPKYANNPSTSAWRWDKYAMQRRLAEEGLPSIRQLLVGYSLRPSELARLTEDFRFPLIVKPIQAGGTQGMARCDSLAEIEAHLSAVAKDRPILCADQFVVQEFIEGEEYFVDTVSIQGSHYLSGVFHNVKQYYQQSNIYRRTEIVDPADPVWQACRDYVKKVLELLDFRNGFAHTEVFMTASGPLLLEVNPRISGAHGYIQKIARLVYGWSQPDLLIDALQGRVNSVPDYSCNSFGVLVYLNNWRRQHRLKPLDQSLLKSLPSYQEATQLQEPGTLVDPPATLLETIAYVLLHHPERGQVEEDYRQIMAWEKEGLLF